RPRLRRFLRPDRNRNGKFKTAVKKKTLNPEFNEDFLFSVSPQELPLKTLEITVWDKDFGAKNDFIGALRLGNKCSGERWTHWEAAIKMPYQTHTVWHPLGVELHHHH
uniref:C2 domain-containing protein n=1 Tax=Macrostomum lignano TaxID=282301 RepID=A0A1I8HW69_9PLAT